MASNRMGQDYLTKPDPEFSRRVDQTIPGMAHFAGSGPANARCGQCAYWHHVDVGIGKSPRCMKYEAMMDGRRGPYKIPKGTPACKYFAADATKVTTTILSGG